MEVDVSTAESPEWLASLDSKFHPVMLRLLERPSWSRMEFEAVAREHHLMPLSVHDAINEWADEHLGDFLLEGDDPISIHRNLIPALTR